jgi:hypothetical protein
MVRWVRLDRVFPGRHRLHVGSGLLPSGGIFQAFLAPSPLREPSTNLIDRYDIFWRGYFDGGGETDTDGGGTGRDGNGDTDDDGDGAASGTSMLTTNLVSTRLAGFRTTMAEIPWKSPLGAVNSTRLSCPAGSHLNVAP